MTGRRVDRLPLARGRTVAQTIVRRAEMRAPLDHMLWDLRLARRTLRRARRPIARHATGFGPPGTVGPIRITGPLPDVAGHVSKPVAVRLKRIHRRGSRVPVELQILPGELPMPGVRPEPTLGGKFLPPHIGRPLQTTSG